MRPCWPGLVVSVEILRKYQLRTGDEQHESQQTAERRRANSTAAEFRSDQPANNGSASPYGYLRWQVAKTRRIPCESRKRIDQNERG